MKPLKLFGHTLPRAMAREDRNAFLHDKRAVQHGFYVEEFFEPAKGGPLDDSREQRNIGGD